MELEVKLFAGLADAAGARSLVVSLAQDARAGDLLAAVAGKLGRDLHGVRVAVNHEYVSADQRLQPQDVVALIPPVSGGSGDDEAFVVQAGPLSLDTVMARVNNPYAGAICLFVGVVREHTDGRQTIALEYEAYDEMAIAELRKIGEQIAQRWPGVLTAISHRTGRLEIGEMSVIVAAASPRRAAAFEAARWAIERLKVSVPVWKREVWSDGTAWIGAQTGDYESAQQRD